MQYVIIGASAAGISCAESIRSSDKRSKIVVITEEEFPLYSRCLLSYYLAGSIKDDGLYFKDKDFFSKNEVETLLGVRADKIDPKGKAVMLSNNKKVAFDKLLIATGSRSKMLGIPGIQKKGVFALRTVKDANGIMEMLGKSPNVVVLGGGLIGLRAAYALRSRGIDVKVVVKSGQVLSQILDEVSAGMIQEKIESSGIGIMKGLDAKEISGDGNVTGVLLENGNKLDCGLVVVGKGVEPNMDLAKSAGIDTAQGIIVNDHLETSCRDIYAAGDVAQTRDVASKESTINAIWPCAVEQGKIAGRNMAGDTVRYGGSLGMNSVEFFGMPVISMGITKPPKGAYEELVARDDKGTYKKVVLKDNIVRGYICVGQIDQSGVYNFLIRNEVDVGRIRSGLLHKGFSFASIAELIKDNKEKFSQEEFQDIVWTY